MAEDRSLPWMVDPPQRDEPEDVAAFREVVRRLLGVPPKHRKRRAKKEPNK